MERIFCTVFLVWCCLYVIVQDGPVLTREALIPPPTGKSVNDFSDVFTPDEEAELDRMLQEQYKNTSNQVVIISITGDQLGDLTIEDFAYATANLWKLGDDVKDNGLLILLVGTAENAEKRGLRFETGKGLEGALPDALCYQIQQTEMVPYLRAGNYFEAFSRGLAAIFVAIQGEYSGVGEANKVPVPRFADYAGIFTPEEEKAIIQALYTVNRPGFLKPLQKICVVTGTKIFTAEGNNVMYYIDRSGNIYEDYSVSISGILGVSGTSRLSGEFIKERNEDGVLAATLNFIRKADAVKMKKSRPFRLLLLAYILLALPLIISWVFRKQIRKIRIGKDGFYDAFKKKGTFRRFLMGLYCILLWITCFSGLGMLPMLLGLGYYSWGYIIGAVVPCFIFYPFAASAVGSRMLGWKSGSGGGSYTYSSSSSGSDYTSYSGSGYSGGGDSYGGGG